ncbi:MAG TPA: NAD(P)/FAD-dependent oxidoreductase [Steroidobacteraceae bacterium]|nr:NAD(P)/FAD-dependent oxidoreductase [Steroidobacteraceae bacterium]
MSASRYDCIVIGAGHNGLTCAAYLARAGRRVLVLEAAGQAGGAAGTREFAPGFRASSCAHLLHLMPAWLLEELRLARHGLQMAAERMPTIALSGASALRIPADCDPTAQDLGDLGATDGAAFQEYAARMRRLARALRPLLEAVPPRLGSRAWRDRLTLLGLGAKVRLLGRADMRELLRIAGMCVQDLLDEHFESPLLKGALAFDAVLGSNLGPRSPGSVFTLLYRLAAGGGAATSLAQPMGGLGALTEALARAATGAGAELRCAAPVARMIVTQDSAAGVLLESGERLEAGCVVSSADPRTTFLRLLGAEHLDAGFVRRVAHLRTQGMTAKLHLALASMPRFTALAGAAPTGRLVLAPSLRAVEQAFNAAKYGRFSAAPLLEVIVPTAVDPTLAPADQHVLSAVVQYAPYGLAGGWEGQREQFLETILQTLEAHAPGIRDCVRAAELLTPQDIETRFRISGGHWHHAELALDQFFMVRPVVGAAQYRAPLRGLFLCGAGCHPGGGVMGLAGHNAARQILAQAA